MAGNQLEALPEDLCTCLNLRDIYAENNKLVDLPKGLHKLPLLSTVNVSENNLQCLPSGKWDTKMSTRFLFDHNPDLNHIPFTFGQMLNRAFSKNRSTIHDEGHWRFSTGMVNNSIYFIQLPFIFTFGFADWFLVAPY